MSFRETRVDADISVSTSKVHKKEGGKKKKRTSKAHATEIDGTEQVEQVEMPSFAEDVLQETQLASIQSSHQAPSTPLRATPAKKSKKSWGRRSSKAKLSIFSVVRSRSRRAGIIFPVGRIKSSLRRRYNRRYRVGIGAAIYLSAVLEYLVAEAVELGGYLATHDKRRRITPRHLMIAIRTDEELNALIGSATFAQSGVVPNIPIALLNGKKMELSKPSFALSATLPM